VEPWDIVYFKEDDGSIPMEVFLDACPPKVEAKLLAVLDAVAEAPPPKFSGGGMWEAMQRKMAGYFEVRVQGPKREQFRLFCLLENAEPAELKRRGLARPALAVITGMRKPWMSTFSDKDYAKVRALGDRYKSKLPRSIATP
jgi:hypothetical protein